MKTGLEEALADCLASVERGGSIEECLARYPGLARELRPLLLTSLGLQQAYDVRPRPSFQRAALQRFLAAAARGGRQPLAAAPPPRRFSFGWRWVPAALGAPALVAAIALATVLAFTGGGGGGARTGITVGHITPVVTPVPAATVTPAPPVPEEVPRLVAQLKEIRFQVDQGGVIAAEDIQELKDINQSLQQTLSEAPPGTVEAAPQIADLLAEQEDVINTAREQDQVAPEAAGDVDDLISIAAAVQTQIDEMLSPTVTPTPEPTLTPTPTPAPTETPAASPTATGTPAASPTAAPTTVSSPTPGPATAAGASPTPPSPSSATLPPNP